VPSLLIALSPRRPKIVGIVNITADSFSDGGLYLEPERAIDHAKLLIFNGADIVELGAASSHPDAGEVTASEEIARLAPVIEVLAAEGIDVAVDTTKREVQRFCMEKGVGMMNDIRGFPDPVLHQELASSTCRLVVMHSVDRDHFAKRRPTDPSAVFHAACAFFRARLEQLNAAGVARERIILDPGMGYFLGSNPETSLAMLGRLAELRSLFDCPLFVSVSRKSFLRNLETMGSCDIASRTLAAELLAASEGAEYIRTHEAGPLHQALITLAAIAGARSPLPHGSEAWT
jgi:dihydropteroate synthase type 2